MSPKLSEKDLKFKENERIFCYQGPLIYEAKCLKAEQQNDGKARYFVHYNGWNKHWDEWVNEGRVLKYNDTNLIKQKEILKQYKDKKRTRSVKGIKNEKELVSTEKRKLLPENVPTSNPQQPVLQVEPKRKRSRIISIEEVPESSVSKAFQEQLKLPDELKPFLVDDWDFITRQKLLFRLPATFTVEAILKKYIEAKCEDKNIEVDQLREMSNGLKEYFNVMLGSQLLYKFERPQYGDIVEKFPSRSASQLYGIPHFIRFFIQIRAVLLTDAGPGPKSLKTLLFWVNDIMVYVKNNVNLFYNANEYETAPADYHRKAMT